MYRTAIDYLKQWKTRRSRKPLVIRGARQVGKSYLVREFARQEFDNLVEVNLDYDKTIASCFEVSEPSEVIHLLELQCNTKFDIGKTLLFIDEIQNAPQLLAKLRYFYEKLPELHIIAAGSLLDFALEQHEFSMPVGRIEYLHLGPMSFSEFLIATGNAKCYDFLTNWKIGDPIPDSLHNKFSDLIRTYTVIGGMPESVQVFADSQSYRESDLIKDTILSTYKDDFSKYGNSLNLQHIQIVYEALPKIVGKKIKYVNISREVKARDLSKALHLLELARLHHLVYGVSCNGIPLGAEINKKSFKSVFLDTGLLLTACGLSMVDLNNINDLTLINSGQIGEQLVGQHLLYRHEFYKQPELHYWLRENKSTNTEIDYVISQGQRIIPIEVKAGKTGSLKSLHQFTITKNIDFAVKICSEKPSVTDVSGRLPDGKVYSSRILTLPFYLLEKLSDNQSEFINTVLACPAYESC